jgi:sugar phosphate isomerase/epimerase
MKLGYVAIGEPIEVIERASRLGFDGVELAFFQNSSCDLDTWTKDDSKEVCDVLAAQAVRVLAVHTGMTNHLAPDKAERERACTQMRRALDIAMELDTDLVTCNAFGDPALRPEAQVEAFGRVFGEYARMAEDRGLRIGIENCPHVHSKHGIQIGNIAYTPELFDLLFDAVPSAAVGMEYDPSHFCWLGVDYVQAIYQFADRIVCVHAKDTEIIEDKLGQAGIYGTGWWRYRIPGMGEVDWDGIAQALAEIGYRGDVIIEHEDPVFAGDRFEEGLSLGIKFLRRLL